MTKDIQQPDPTEFVWYDRNQGEAPLGKATRGWFKGCGHEGEEDGVRFSGGDPQCEFPRFEIPRFEIPRIETHGVRRLQSVPRGKAPRARLSG
jgi:hypothetical protein